VKFGLKKLNITLSCGVVWYEIYLDILNRLGVYHDCDGRTDGRTERTAVSNSTVYRPALKT